VRFPTLIICDNGRIFLKKIFLAIFFVVAQILLSQFAHAGADLWANVQRMQIDGAGTIWFAIDSPDSTKYCKPYWFEMNMYIKPDNPQYVYYYGILLTAITKGKAVVIANISTFDGTVSCDIAKTGYGIVIMA